MDTATLISFIGQNKVGLQLEVEGKQVLEIKPNGDSTDVNILDMDSLKKLKEEYKKWKG